MLTAALSCSGGLRLLDSVGSVLLSRRPMASSAGLTPVMLSVLTGERREPKRVLLGQDLLGFLGRPFCLPICLWEVRAGGRVRESPLVGESLELTYRQLTAITGHHCFGYATVSENVFHPSDDDF